MLRGGAFVIVAAGAALLYSVSNQADALIIIGNKAVANSILGRGPDVCSGGTEERLSRAERRIAAFDAKIARSQRELARARATLMITRHELMNDDDEGELIQDLPVR
jgi:hypothetical protein